ncbi:hypothetical protein [Alkalihalobacterium chitinilyticum]|uniref:YhfM-like domain-containing protein n=1 Tax=Alkalihalobacterium chitinilyticum TaxID=2980103 RepID=A0ABT5VDB1_9BACI|nr:hypothetical protein [Alkalihalobacterium chitinilyticum]MDE5413312.1 hypothetical protein [Alkalihalobacterium chitinilyticum]
MVRLSFISLFLFLIGIVVVGCSNEKVEKVEKITIYKMESFSVIVEDSVVDIVEPDEIEIIQKAFNQANKEPGIVDITDPQYRVEWGENSYFLWISENSGTIMNTTNTHTIYSLTKAGAQEVFQLIDRTVQ